MLFSPFWVGGYFCKNFFFAPLAECSVARYRHFGTCLEPGPCLEHYKYPGTGHTGCLCKAVMSILPAETKYLCMEDPAFCPECCPEYRLSSGVVGWTGHNIKQCPGQRSAAEPKCRRSENQSGNPVWYIYISPWWRRREWLQVLLTRAQKTALSSSDGEGSKKWESRRRPIINALDKTRGEIFKRPWPGFVRRMSSIFLLLWQFTLCRSRWKGKGRGGCGFPIMMQTNQSRQSWTVLPDLWFLGILFWSSGR